MDKFGQSCRNYTQTPGAFHTLGQWIVSSELDPNGQIPLK